MSKAKFLKSRRRYLDVLSSVYGCLSSDTTYEGALKNSLIREVISNERDIEYYKNMCLVSTMLSVLTMKPGVALEMQKKLTAKFFPWENLEKEVASQDKEEAIKKFKQMQASGTINAVEKEIAVQEVFEKWQDPLAGQKDKK